MSASRWEGVRSLGTDESGHCSPSSFGHASRFEWGGGGGRKNSHPLNIMGKLEEIVRIAKKMDKMVSKKDTIGAIDLLKELKSIPMTLDILQSTRVGMSVNAVRKQSTDEEVTTLAKSLIKSWKKLLDGPTGDKDAEEKKKDCSTSSKNSSNSSQQSSSKRPEPRTPTTPKITTFPPIPITSDTVRNKCREMLSAALQTDKLYLNFNLYKRKLTNVFG